ncbi:MAG: M1 family metallopeptidase [Sphingomonas sp.]|uniref:M1 family metallopeptidase n=1 Tax=Sphingomonas sp. TaxID=28214 RepID=UPI00356619FF
MRSVLAVTAAACAMAVLGCGSAASARDETIVKADDPDAAAKFMTPHTRAQGGPRPAEQMALTFEHLDLSTKVFPEDKRLESDAVLTLKATAPVRTLILDLFPKFVVSAIYLDGRKISPSTYSNPEGQLRIALPKPLAAGRKIVARVVYSGTPPLAKRPPWEGGTTWLKTDAGQPWIDTSLWGGGCDLLYPCIDHPTRKPDTTDLHYTVPKGLMAPGNGKFMGSTEKDGWTTWNWHGRSIHHYGAVLDVGPYKVMEAEYQSRFGNHFPMDYYYLPGEEKQAAELFKEFPVALDFFESQIGPYPWSDQKMGVIHVKYSGLENQTLNGYTGNYVKTPTGFDPLMNHEFSHEWFANQLSNANYDDLWLHEGIGSYMQPLLADYLHGKMDMMSLLMSQRAGIRNEKPLVSGKELTEKQVYLDPEGPRGDIYPKGSWVMHSLRNLIGDEAFFKSVRILVYGRPDPKPGNFQPQFGSTQGYLKIVNQVTGKDLGWFFHVYLYRAALPKLVSEREGGKVKLHWQTPDNLPFPMPVDVRIDGKTTALPMTDGTGELPIDAFSSVTFDPESKILMQSDAIDRLQEYRAAHPDGPRR